MKCLLDTNVLIAGLVARGTGSDLVEHCVRQHTIISSQRLLAATRTQVDFVSRENPTESLHKILRRSEAHQVCNSVSAH